VGCRAGRDAKTFESRGMDFVFLCPAAPPITLMKSRRFMQAPGTPFYVTAGIWAVKYRHGP